MRFWDMLRSRLRSLFFRDRREADLTGGAAVPSRTRDRTAAGDRCTRDAARLQALRTFGGPSRSRTSAAMRAAPALVDDTVRDIVYALRGVQARSARALTIVFTVALGLGLVTVAFTLLNMLLFRVDQVPNVHEMFALERPRISEGDRVPFTRAQFDALRRETSVFTDAYAQVADVDSRVDGRRSSARSSPATSSRWSASRRPWDGR